MFPAAIRPSLSDLSLSDYGQGDGYGQGDMA
jgi:hypothetical protein